MRLFATLILITTLSACTPGAPRSGGDILMIGDSVLAWNRTSGRDVGTALGASLDRTVTNRATPGAQIRKRGFASALGLGIPDQLVMRPWNWVVMNGGANDLGFTCGCTRCDGVIEALISRDGTTGDIPTLINRARSTGAKVLWMGYYRAPNSGSFQGCRPGLVEIERRVARLARTSSGVFFVDSEDVIAPRDPSLYAADATHPSPKGSAVIGQYLAQTIKAN
ncbi:SGNH/GDSL hydrolase family protein [uncultured Roseovarius sp.]|uniref:SGNH/GDSL hydrolase family protein n=1 Tax=uncultured Roseovarius sp. TaxID=293344 RepID=UPI0025EF1D2B|nr:SGNH/GDSL hydrolase family protein [uncultured Roseovarius sp.]